MVKAVGRDQLVPMERLRRDLLLLRQGGWDIDNVAAEGAGARHRLRVRRNRLAALLTPGERAAPRDLVGRTSIDHAVPPAFLGALVARHILAANEKSEG